MIKQPLLEYKIQKTKNGQMGYVSFGIGCPLIMLVGYSGTLFHWNNLFVTELAKRFKVYLIDNRLVGKSHSTNEQSMNGMAYDVCDFIEAVGLIKPWILGWSMGGGITQELASFYKSNLSGIILLATVASNRYVNSDFLMFMAYADSLPKNEFKKNLYQFFFSQIDYLHKIYDLKSNALSIADYNYRFTYNAKIFQDYVVITWNGITSDTLKTIDIPVLILWAKDDMVVINDAPKYQLEHIPKAKLITYDEGGHFLIHIDPVRVAQDITNFKEIEK